MNRKQISVLAVAAAVMAATAYLAYPNKSKSTIDLSKARYMHCPECKKEKMYSPAAFDNPCPYCDKRLVATTEPTAQSGSYHNPYGTMVVLLLTETVLGLGTFWFVSRQRVEAAGQEVYFYLQCPKCRQKIRYRERQAGMSAQCRRCRKSFVYPPCSQEEFVE